MTTAETPAKPAAKTTAAKSAAKPAVKAAAKPVAAKPAAASVAAAPAPIAAAPVAAAPAPAPVAITAKPAAIALPALEIPALDEVSAKAQAAALKSYEDVSAVAKDTLDAMVASSEVLSQGLQILGDTVYGLTQQSIDETVTLSKQLASAKTLRELIELQSSLAKTQVDRLLTEAPRLGDMSVKMIEDAIAPISASVNAAVDKLVKAAA